MKKNIEKKPWKKAELVVLTRTRPEEAVLAACKPTDDPPVSGPSNGSYACTSQNACYDTGSS